MSAKTNSNGQVRKSLAEEINRLEALVDALGEGLNQAVATAVEQAVTTAVNAAVREAVQGVLEELLASPEFLALLRAAVARPNADAAKPRRVVSHFAQVRAWVCGKLRQAREVCGSALGRVGNVLAGVRRAVVTLVATARDRLWLVRQFKVQLLTALGVGAAAGVAAYYAGPWLSAGLGCVGGFVATLAVQAGVALRRLGMTVLVRT